MGFCIIYLYLLLGFNKFGHTKICFSTVDHNANGSLSRIKWLAFPGFFHGISIAVAVLKLLVPSGVPDLTCHATGPILPTATGLPQVSDGRHTMCPNLLTYVYYTQ
jgi:hypothetical protein